MIQRVQTLFLAGASLALILLFFFPLATFYDELLGNFRFFITTLEPMDPDPKLQVSIWFASPLYLITAFCGILTLATIFFYKNRPRQVQVIAIAIFLNILLIVLIFFFYINRIEKLTGITASYQFGIFLPLISLLFLVLANRFIRKDEQLVKSADRLR